MSDFIEITNEHGQKIDLPRDTYREKIIPQKLEQYWNEKEQLRQFAIELVSQGFNEEGAKAADRLIELFGPIEPSLIFRAVVHMQAHEFDQAKQLLLYVIHHYPNSGNAFTNLAKIFAHEGDEEKAFEILEGGLVKDPNQDNGLDWYVANFLEHGKKEQLFERLELIGKQEGAWRPQLIMGRLALEDENLLLAMDKYQEAITNSGNNEVTIMNVTGELGQAGYVYQLIQVAEKHWQPTFEYPYTGFNYANALITTDQKQQAVTVLKAMLPHIREDFKEVVNRFLEQLPQELLEETHDESSNQDADKKPWWKVW